MNHSTTLRCRRGLRSLLAALCTGLCALVAVQTATAAVQLPSAEAACDGPASAAPSRAAAGAGPLVGMTDTAAYFPLLRGRRVAVLANHTSVALRSELGDAACGAVGRVGDGCGRDKVPGCGAVLSAGAAQNPAAHASAATSAATSAASSRQLAMTPAGEGWVHLVDLLHECGFDLRAIFSPEHGFRGEADAGAHVQSSVDARTGVPIRSLYDGRTQRPSDEAMRSFDVLVVDLQDVGLRFYTYYITMLRMMEACADYGIPVVVLDRPNPNGRHIDGPVLDMKYRSGVGALPLPVLHGLTMGEIARMAVGEGWTPPCSLEVVPCRRYTHATPYRLPVAPSPNLRTQRAVYLYASLCLFEGTVVSLGRGTDCPFECYGHPDLAGDFSFTPRPTAGAAHPPLEGRLCHGRDLRKLSEEEAAGVGFSLGWLLEACHGLELGERFFTPMFEKLVGVGYLRPQILEGATEEQMRARWSGDLARYRAMRLDYLLYPDGAAEEL